MEFQHINAKVYVEGELGFDPTLFIAVFHQWIQEQSVPELLIDVADYCHVPDGPGVLLVAHEADYSMDHSDGQWGLRYNRKAALAGSNEQRIRQALSAAAKACCLLEAAFRNGGPLKFSRTRFEVLVNDRALAPQNAEATSAFASDLRACVAELLGHTQLQLRWPVDKRRLLGAEVTSSRPFDLATISGKVG